MAGWARHRAALRTAEAHRFRAVARRLPWRRRADVVLAGLAAGLVAGLLALLLAVVEIGERHRLFDPPVLAPVADDRLLDNLRDGLGADPITAAAPHAVEGTLYVAQRGGAVHRYDPETGLWATGRPFGEGTGLPGGAVALRAGCGAGPRAADGAGCADPETLWALGAGGGLARRGDDGWRVLLPESAFLGVGGEPVQGADLTAAAVSGDGTRLVLGTRDAGIGLYDLTRRTWVPLPAEAAAVLPATAITGLRWWRDRFWIGTPAGLAVLHWSGDGGAEGIVADAVPGIDGAVRDLDVVAAEPADGGGIGDDADALLVLETRQCPGGGEDCLRLSRLAGVGGQAERLIDEQARYPDLDLDDLIFATLQDGQVVVFGALGVHRYDPRRHAWSRLDGRPVLAAMADGGGVTYGLAGGVGRIVSGAVAPVTWDLGAARVARLAPGPGGDVYAQTEAGEVFALAPDGSVHPALRRSGTGIGPDALTGAVAADDLVLLTGPGDAVLHDMARRTYTRIPAGALAPFLRDPRRPAYVSGGLVYGMIERGGRAEAVAVDLQLLEAGAGGVAGHSAPVPAPVTAVQPWPGAGLSLIDGGGTLRRVDIGTAALLTGAPLPPGRDGPFRDVLATPDALYAATGRGVEVYGMAGRGWREPLGTGIDGGDMRGLAMAGGRLLAHTGAGRLVAPGRGTAPSRVLIGAGEGFAIAGADMTDALAWGSGVYVAGAGRIERYDMRRRQVTARWRLTGGGPVDLIDVAGGRPVALAGERAWYGTGPLAPAAGPVRAAFVHDGHVWTVRDAGSHRWLMGHPLRDPGDGAPVCLFRRPATGPGATAAIAVRRIAPDWLAALADDGLWLYGEAARSWYRGPAGPAGPDDRLYRLGDRLVRVSGPPGARTLAVTDLAGVALPDGCETGPVAMPARTTAAAAVAVDEAAGALAWLTPAGAVLRLDAGADGESGAAEPVEVLAAPGGGPDSAALRRVFARDGRLYLTTADAVWRYGLDGHRWQRIGLTVGAAPATGVRDLILEPVGGVEAVTATLADGGVAVGLLGARDRTVRLRRVDRPTVPPFRQAGAAILDVQRHDGHWLFVLDDRIKRLDPVTRTWAPDIVFPEPDAGRRFGTIAGHPVVEAAEGRSWWIASGPLPADPGPPVAAADLLMRHDRAVGDVVALAEGPGLVRLQPDGTVSACPVAPGEPDCRPLLPAAMPLDPDGVRAAFIWADRILFLTADGPRLYDRTTGAGMPVAAPDGPPEPGPALADALWRMFGGTVLRVGGDRYRIAPGGATAALERAPDEPGSARPPTVARDAWPALAPLATPRRDGTPAFDPVTALRVDPASGALEAVRPSGPVRLAARAGTGLRPEPALDAGWLRWDRSAGAFAVHTGDGLTLLPPDEMVRDGRLIFGVPGVLAAERVDRLHHANRHGVWTFAAVTPDLEDPGTTYRPVPLDGLTGAAHGRFLLRDGSLPFDSDAVRPDDATLRVALGDAVIEERLRGQGLDGRLSVSGRPAPLFAERGFRWDRRHGLALAGGRLYVHSDAGIHPADGFAGFDAGPVRLAPGSGWTLHGGDRLRVRHDRGGDGVWYERTGDGAWARLNGAPEGGGRPGPDGRRARTVADSPDPSGRAGREVLPDTGDGLAFAGDRLRTAAAHDGRLYVLTAAALEVADNLEVLRAGRADRHAPAEADRLEAVEHARGGPALYARQGDAALVWDGAAFRPAADDPFRRRVLVAGPRLRVEREDGAVRFVLRVDPPEGGPARWVPVAPADGRLPFDVVTSVAAAHGTLYVGTRAGLQVYPVGGGTGLDAMTALIDLRAGAAGPLQPVDRVGVPATRPSVVAARSPDRCLLLAPAGGAADCPDPAIADRLVRGATALWRWERDGDTPAGAYLDAAGRPLPDPPDLDAGRFDHDRLADFVACGEVSAALWRDGRVSVHPAPAPVLDRLRLTRPAGAAPRRLTCLDRPAVAAGVTLAPGLYLEQADGTVRRHDGAGWRALTPAEADALAPRTDGRVAVERGRLRLLTGGGAPPRFQYRRDEGQGGWRDLAWAGDRLAIDRVERLAGGGRRTWLATADGFVAVRPGRDRDLLLDPDLVRIVPLPEPDCRVSDFALAGIEAVVRCNESSARVFAGDLATPDGDFRAMPEGADPFADRTLIDTPAWTWTLTGRRDGRRGEVAIDWRGAPLALTGGRFAFDGITALAAVRAGAVDFVTATGGWYRAPDGRFDAGAVRRPAAAPVRPQTATAVGVARRGADRLLCVALEDGGGLLVGADGAAAGRVAACLDDQGHDGRWAYAAGADGLRMTTPGRRGRPGERRLRDGRFDDTVATGLPVPSRRNGMAEHLVPTRAGVVAFGADGAARGLYLPPFAGLADEAVPLVLYAAGDGPPAYLAGDRLRALEIADAPACDGLAALMARLPEPAAVRALDPAPGDGVRVTWGPHDRPDWAIVSCGPDAAVARRTLTVDAGGWRRFVSRRAAWGDPPAALTVRVEDDAVIVGTAGGRRVVPLPDGAAPVLAAVPFGPRLVLVTAAEAARVDLAVAMTDAFDGVGAAAPAPPPPDAEPRPAPGPSPENAPTPAAATAGAPAAAVPIEAETDWPAAMRRAIQERLSALGLYGGRIDAIFGPLTRAAIRRYQQDLGAAPTGRLTPDQVERLLARGDGVGG